MKYYLIPVLLFAHFSCTGQTQDLPADTANDLPYLQVSALNCEFFTNPFRQDCTQVWQNISVMTTGKDHTHQWIVLYDPQGSLEHTSWVAHARYRSTDPDEIIDITFETGPHLNLRTWANTLMEARDAYVASWEVNLNNAENDMQDLLKENRYLLGYYPTMGITATFTLIITDGDDAREELQAEIQVRYPGA